jgi:hypothetical protein
MEVDVYGAHVNSSSFIIDLMSLVALYILQKHLSTLPPPFYVWKVFCKI